MGIDKIREESKVRSCKPSLLIISIDVFISWLCPLLTSRAQVGIPKKIELMSAEKLSHPRTIRCKCDAEGVMSSW